MAQLVGMGGTIQFSTDGQGWIPLDTQSSGWSCLAGWNNETTLQGTAWTSGYIDGDMDSREDWRCPYCGALNPGESRKCGTQFIGCGAPRRE
jgi:hypothetical protein